MMYETPLMELVQITDDIITTSFGVMTPFLPVEDEGEWEIV